MRVAEFWRVTREQRELAGILLSGESAFLGLKENKRALPSPDSVAPLTQPAGGLST